MCVVACVCVCMYVRVCVPVQMLASARACMCLHSFISASCQVAAAIKIGRELDGLIKRNRPKNHAFTLQ